MRGFSLVRRLLPATLALQILAAATATVAAVIFEAGLLAQSGLSGDAMKLLGIAAVAVGAILWAAGRTVLGLRRALAAFEPDPLPIFGRRVSPAEAPGLWRLTEGLAERLGALKPEAVVVGLTGGFFVSAGPAVLEPGGERLTGRILYLPLPYLALMRGDEVAAIIGHELAHYAGGDTAYSQRFLPIYAGVGRSLDAVAAGHQGSLGLLGPSLRLGLFVMERFHLAVRHWSRAREFAADAAGAGLTTPEAAARALLRTGAVQPRIAEALDAAAETPGGAPADLVAAALDRAVARGLDDPGLHLEAEQAHPTDTHPPTRERVAALGVALDPDLLARAAATPPPHALGQLGGYFADPAGLSRDATADFLGAVRDHEAAVRAHLEATAEAVDEADWVLRDNSRPGAIVLLVSGGLFAAAALGLVGLGLPGLATGQAGLVAGVALALGALLAAFGAYRLRRGERTTLILRPAGLAVPGLDRTIAWGEVADLDMRVNRTGLVTRLLLSPQTPFPGRVPGGRGLTLDLKRRIVTIALGLPRRMTPQDFADAIGRYRAMAEARRLLAEADGGSADRRPADAAAPAAAPVPPRLPSPALGWINAFWVLFGVACLGAVLVACAIYTAPVVASDWQVRARAEPVPGARVHDASCSAKLILHICDATLSLPTPGGAVTRRVNYVFAGLQAGEVRLAVLADPARPDLATTDLGLDRLWNRTVTLLVIALLIVACIVGAIASLVRSRRESRPAAG